MKSMLNYAAVGALAAVQVVMFPTQSNSFELFGVHLWGERESDLGLVIIDPLPYSVTVNIGGEDSNVLSLVEGSSSLWKDREQPASGVAGLISKGRGDYRRILAGLYNEGYFGSEISILAAGNEVSGLNLAADLPTNVPIVINVNAGRRFTFGKAEIVNAPPVTTNPDDIVDDRVSSGFVSGQDARAVAIAGETQVSIERWRQLARAKAREDSREVIADHPNNVLDVTVTLDPGPKVRYGTVRAEGSKGVDSEFIEYIADIPPGGEYDPDHIDDSYDRLSLLGTFDSIKFEEGEVVGPDGLMPITIQVLDRKKRTIGAGGTYSTLDGVGISAYYLHRNLFGRAEKLRFDVSVEKLLMADNVDQLNYNLGVTFTKPGALDPQTSFITAILARQLDVDTYREKSVTGRIGFSRIFNDKLQGELFALASRARFIDDFGTRDFMLFGLSGRGEYDRRDNELDPTQGYYLSASLSPTYDLDYGNSAVRATLEGRKYFGFGEERWLVLAGRAKLGSYVGPSVEEAPPNQLFFAGGGGSVRGYAYQSIGVDSFNSAGDPIVVGGHGLLELSGEVRARFTERWGAVGFLDTGLVTGDSNFTEADDIRTGAGLGARMYTGFGPVRFDVAVPLDPGDDDDKFAIYIGIGQAF